MNLKRRWAHPTLALLTLGEHTSSVGAVPGTVGTDHGMVGVGGTMEHFLALLGVQLECHKRYIDTKPSIHFHWLFPVQNDMLSSVTWG